jgi:hypothetical protein
VEVTLLVSEGGNTSLLAVYSKVSVRDCPTYATVNFVAHYLARSCVSSSEVNGPTGDIASSGEFRIRPYSA